MDQDLFQEGGPYNVKKIGHAQYSLSIPVPTDQFGLSGRECPSEKCSPGYFKVKSGTGITGGQTQAFCPYCRTFAPPENFMTQAQLEYGKQIAEREAIRGTHKIIKDIFRSVNLSMQQPRLPLVGRLIEEELRRDVVCPYCGLVHAVFGLATWCPDCGKDIFKTHLVAELNVLRKTLSSVEERRTTLGPRVAARDVENALEDLVSVIEAVLKAVTTRHLFSLGKTQDEIDNIIEKQIQNSFQNFSRAREVISMHTGATLGRNIQESDLKSLMEILEKRHPIAHNLGVVDRKYLAKARSGEIAGREVRVTADRVVKAADVVESILLDLLGQLFPSE